MTDKTLVSVERGLLVSLKSKLFEIFSNSELESATEINAFIQSIDAALLSVSASASVAATADATATPETDSLRFAVTVVGETHHVVFASFARKLERELIKERELHNRTIAAWQVDQRQLAAIKEAGEKELPNHGVIGSVYGTHYSVVDYTELRQSATSIIAARDAKIAELENNEREYERLLGPKTYRELAEDFAALKAQLSEAKAVIDSARELSDSLNGGFVRCERCGSQEDTTDLDFAGSLREAIVNFDAARAKAEGVGS